MTPQESSELSGQILEEQTEFSITEVCSICAVEERQIVQLVQEGIIETHSITQWRFSGNDLRRARIALRLQRGLTEPSRHGGGPRPARTHRIAGAPSGPHLRLPREMQDSTPGLSWC